MNFFTRYKKLFLILGFAVLVFILGYLLYVLFFKPITPTPPSLGPEVATTTTGFPTAEIGPGQIITPTTKEDFPKEEGKIVEKKASPIARGGLTETTELSKTSNLGAVLANNGSDLQYYDQENGQFYRIDKNGETTLLSDKIFHQIEKITWSPDKNKAILEYPDGANIVYDFASEKQITLPSHWKDFDFSSAGDKIVMKSIGLDPSNRWLAVANNDGSKVRGIESLGDKDSTVYPSWSPNGQSIAMYTKGVDFDRQEVFFVGLNKENFKSTIIEGRGFRYQWAPEEGRLLYSVYSSENDLKPSLWVVNAEGESIGTGRKNLHVETWADKCTFANNTDLYCAVPNELEAGAGLFPEMAKTTNDRLYKIDARTGLKKLVAIPDEAYNMSNLIVSENGYYLYFTDEKTKRLHKIKLK
jgi:hypothetical protein